MDTDIECPICEADIPLDGDERDGDFILCSFCNVTFKIFKKREKWVLIEDDEV